MSRTALIALLYLLVALNLVVFVTGVSRQSEAAQDTTNYERLIKDPHFTRAVKSIIEACRVNVNIARVRCS